MNVIQEKKKSYPKGYSDKELSDLINKYGEMHVNNPALGPSYFSKATLGLIELHSRENKKIAIGTLIVASLALLISGYGVWLTKKQTDYTEVQSRQERIFQTQREQRALEFCKENPSSQDSGLYYISSGEVAPCTAVLESFDN